MTGNRKDVSVKETKPEFVKGKANAKVDRVAADSGSHEMNPDSIVITEYASR